MLNISLRYVNKNFPGAVGYIKRDHDVSQILAQLGSEGWAALEIGSESSIKLQDGKTAGDHSTSSVETANAMHLTCTYRRHIQIFHEKMRMIQRNIAMHGFIAVLPAVLHRTRSGKVRRRTFR